MITVTEFQAKAHFSELLRRAEKGETIQITRNGRPIARLVPETGLTAQDKGHWDDTETRLT